MGKCTGCYMRCVKYQTPKVAKTNFDKQVPGRAGQRQRVAKRRRLKEEQKKCNTQPCNRYTKLDDYPHSSLETKSRKEYEKYQRTHHQEGGQHVKRIYVEARNEKQQNLEPFLREYEEFSSEDDEEEFFDQEGSEESSEVSQGELTDLEFMTFAKQVSYDTRSLGFTLEENFLTDEDMSHLLKNIEAGCWINDNQNRRVQIFGYNFLLPQSEHVVIPGYFRPVLEKLASIGFGHFTELLVAEYLPGVGLEPHVDRFFWQEGVVGISLLSTCQLELQNFVTKETISHHLVPGSMYSLRGPARYECTHSIPPKSVLGRRISLTFRNLSKDLVVVSPETADILQLK
eukprot:TRINITY_DN27297_c0_g1_i1.p1 TRINITY_DN27297_c0_g1~~TRINITY_DN27297_c0_g1_i1.p1  ORF type:complete len:343 (+),score=46.77 TRINITY_DN27297_c0_g1_i1:47-1075(+)